MTLRMRLMSRLMVGGWYWVLLFIYSWIGLYLLMSSLWLSILERGREPKANRALSIGRLDRARKSQALPIFIGLG